MTDQDTSWIRHLVGPLRVKPGARVNLARDYDPGARFGVRKKRDGVALLERGVDMLAEYQDRLAAQDTWGVLVVLQALDAAGKDGTIRHVMSGVNPQSVKVASFKAPSAEELRHDYLERLPPAHKGKSVWARRYREINDWEHYLVDNGIRVVKLFLNLSRDEQRVRFLKRIDQPEKNWKFSASDVRERRHWDEYQKAYSEMLSHTSTEWAPWHVLPADRKWFTRVCAAAVIAETLIDIDPQYPGPDPDARQKLLRAKTELESEVAREAATAPTPASAARS